MARLPKYWPISPTFRDSFHLSFTIHKSRGGRRDQGMRVDQRQGEEIQHSRLGEVSMQRFDLSTKRYPFNNERAVPLLIITNCLIKIIAGWSRSSDSLNCTNS